MTTFNVTNTNSSGTGSLRQAILDANATPGVDTIAFTGATFTDATPDTIRLREQLVINDSLTIAGTGINSLIISGDNNGNGINDEGDIRVFWINQGNVNLSNLTIANGRAKGGDGGIGGLGGGGGAGGGGGLFIKSGTVAIDSVAFVNNQAIGGKGGDSNGNGGGGGGGLGGNGGKGGSSRNQSGGGGAGSGGSGVSVSDENNGGGSGGSGSLWGGSGGYGGIGYDPVSNPNYGLTNGQSGGYGGGGGGGGFTNAGANNTPEAVSNGLGGNGGDFGGGGGGGGYGGYGGGGGGGNGPGINGGGAGRAASQATGVLTARRGAGSTSEGGPLGGGGGGAGLGGAIFVNETAVLTLSNSQFSQNTAQGGQGGTAKITLFTTNEMVDASGEAGQGKGGAIYVRAGATLRYAPGSLSFSSNTAANPTATPTDNNNLYSAGTMTEIVPPPPPPPDPNKPTEGNDTLTGTPGSDQMVGLGGDDQLSGLAGNDRIIGGNGNDRIIGGMGKDTCIGGKGRDLFILGRKQGRDLIIDFKDRQDKLGLSDGLKFKNLKLKRQGNGTLITAGSDQLAVLKGVKTNLITAADFTVVQSVV